MPDDLISIHHKQSCNFGFATHLFGTEIKALYYKETVPRGVTFRISATSSSDLLNGDESGGWYLKYFFKVMYKF